MFPNLPGDYLEALLFSVYASCDFIASYLAGEAKVQYTWRSLPGNNTEPIESSLSIIIHPSNVQCAWLKNIKDHGGTIRIRTRHQCINSTHDPCHDAALTNQGAIGRDKELRRKFQQDTNNLSRMESTALRM